METCAWMFIAALFTIAERQKQPRQVSTDGWMDGWMDGWIDGYMDGWMDGWMDG